jgi:pimeloyl-ACP methyl ester carboxylesterase
VLLLHGFLSAGSVWQRVARELAGRHEVLAPDLLGYGSARDHGPEYNLDRVVEHLAPLVERERPTHVVGHSMGALVALALDGAMPGVFARTGLIGLPHFRDAADGAAHQARRGLTFGLFLRSHGLAHYFCEAMHPLRFAWQPLGRLIVPRQPRETFSSMFDHSRSGHVGGLEEIVFANHVERLACEAAGPVAVLHGDRDRAAPLDRVREIAVAHGWDLRVARGAGHQVVVERPALVARWLEECVLSP